jgi:hypothetical protein
VVMSDVVQSGTCGADVRFCALLYCVVWNAMVRYDAVWCGAVRYSEVQ